MAHLSSIDTGVLVEFMDESGDFHLQATSIVESVMSGRLTGLIPHPVLAELYYVSYRIFENVSAAKGEDKENDGMAPRLRAEKLLNWFYKSPNILVPENTIELAIEAGKIKQKLGFALSDSYVLASAKLNHCEAIFKSREEEMKRRDKLARLGREKIGVVFLEDYA